MLSYVIDDPRTAADTAAAWQRLAELIPGASARIEVERRLEATFHGGPVGIALRDASGKLVDCNEAFVRFVDAPNAEALMGTQRRDLIDLEACDEPTRELITDDAVFEGLELPFTRSDDEPVWGRVTTTFVEEGSGSVMLDHVEDVTLTRATQEALARARRRDALTGLPNRVEIEAQLARRIANHEPITVTAVDLDHFSTMNASLGHIAGDRLLQLVAERLQLIVGARAELARTGGDEFIVVSATASQQLARDLADRILASLRLPFEIDGHELLTGASVGVCIARGASTPSEILLEATEALNEAKQSGRNRVVHHQSKSRRRRAGLFESELRRAVHERTLEVYYQPEFDVDTRLIVGAEALVRWNHPTEGLLAAGSFVPLIEELGLSSELCDHVLHDACSAANEWRAALSPNPFKIRINLSPRDIEQSDIVERVMRTIDDSGLPVSSLCLEVTETAVMRDQRRVVQHLRALSDLGISLAIDDFGTGFSSLWLLRELPFDTLKIDQAFIAALDSGLEQDRVIVETIVKLGQTLGMEVTAEGVETTSQFDMLGEIGIKRAQGFLLARPEPKAVLVESIARAAAM
jgi:diguanylate cyclase (GGDEF)-like protein